MSIIPNHGFTLVLWCQFSLTTTFRISSQLTNIQKSEIFSQIQRSSEQGQRIQKFGLHQIHATSPPRTRITKPLHHSGNIHGVIILLLAKLLNTNENINSNANTNTNTNINSNANLHYISI